MSNVPADMDGRQRRFLCWLTALASLCLVAQGLTGVDELTLYLTPLFLIGALLLSGHYVAEDAIVRLRLGRTPPRVRRAVPLARPPRVVVLVRSLLERTPQVLRGPPAVRPLAA